MAQVYKAPLRDMRFVLHELFADGPFTAPARHGEFDPDLFDAVLEEAARICEGELLPLNASGDREGCKLDGGAVRTPEGFKAAYKHYCENGWASLSADPIWGGQGLPETVAKLVEEMVCATNLSFSLYPGLTEGAILAIDSHASDEIKQTYLPRMVAGEWSGTMCLTESHCGSDLGLLRTIAEPGGDGSYRINGSKIFISAGDHDLADNIVHLVLARLPDAPPGVKGISMFLVPKKVPEADGSPGADNGVRVAGIEHKMGMKASVTCEMTFEDARGWLIGEPHRGLAAMFTMMNRERLSIGLQGLGIAEVAYQSSLAYAKERLQGRSASGAKFPDLPADPIIVHPDVRRMLMTMKVYAEGCRALGQLTARALDAEKDSEDQAERDKAASFVAMMTPVVKAFVTDIGSEAANLAVQVYGGHGYIVEHGVEQLVRDARIAQIYEGTNGIQALDLAARKVARDSARSMKPFFDMLSHLVEASPATDHPRIARWRDKVRETFETAQQLTDMIVGNAAIDPEEAGAVATDYLRFIALLSLGYCFLKAALIANQRIGEGSTDGGFYEAKLASAQFFFDRLFPFAAAHATAVRSGKSSMMQLPAEAF